MSLRSYRSTVLKSKRDGLAEIEERALTLRETAKTRDRLAKSLDAGVVTQKDGKRRFNADIVSFDWFISLQVMLYLKWLHVPFFIGKLIYYNMSKATESKPAKQEVSCSVMLHPRPVQTRCIQLRNLFGLISFSKQKTVVFLTCIRRPNFRWTRHSVTRSSSWGGQRTSCWPRTVSCKASKTGLSLK